MRTRLPRSTQPAGRGTTEGCFGCAHRVAIAPICSPRDNDPVFHRHPAGRRSGQGIGRRAKNAGFGGLPKREPEALAGGPEFPQDCDLWIGPGAVSR
jgi:hypothetical protein